MDFSKINGEIKPKEETPKVIKKEEAPISFSDVLSSNKKTYTLPSLGETSVLSGSDYATISESGKSAYYLLKIKSMVKDIPDIRDRKIENGIKLIKDGIDSQKINKEIAKKITDTFFPSNNG